jgi:glycosyltransferase involved in cell wall biosynthesis
MHVWLVTVGEPLPVLSGNSRLWRTGMVAQELIRRGHSVVWWTSRVDHFRKEFFTAAGPSLEPYAGLTIRLLEGDLYRRNVSVARLINHWQIGRNFAHESRNMLPPDLILCSFPTIELSLAAVRFARERGIPIVLDVRDLWPDIFLQPAPRWLRGALRALLWPYFAATRRALSGADAIIAVSGSYLEWGLAGAGRAGRPPDRVYPLAYDLPEQLDSARAAGLEMFRRLGVKSDCIVCLFAGTLGRTYDLSPVLECATGHVFTS